MKVSEFLPIHAIRAPNIMWFLGAGASASAGIQTAWNMIWDFKRKIFCTENRVSLQRCQDLSDRRTRSRIQAYFDSLDGAPRPGSDEEYGYYFERLHPSPGDRQRYIDRLVSAGKPSYGHAVLAGLLRTDRVRVVWTTNFDRMVEDATLALFRSSGQLSIADLDHSRLAMEAMNEGRWPLLVKLHGDFQSRRLKNTPEELQSQDAELRRALVEGCRRYGLAVVGYSGRDHSVMDALEEAIDDGRGYPAGLFWFNRAETPPSERVTRLIANAAEAGIDAHLIDVDTFDALLGDLLLLADDLPADVAAYINQRPRRISDAPLPSAAGGWPVIRFNALRLGSFPSTCRRVQCKIGGSKEVHEAVDKSGAEIIAARVRAGVLAFGSDAEVRKAFANHDLCDFDLHPIEERRLRFESQELGLLYAALAHALGREVPVQVIRNRAGYRVIADAAREADPAYAELCRATKKVTGVVPRTQLRWAEAARVRLEGRLGSLWLVLEPTVWIERTDDDAATGIAREFARERRAERFNRQWNEVLDGWIHLLLGGAEEREVRAFGTADGVDAVFSLTRHTAFSRRIR